MSDDTTSVTAEETTDTAEAAEDQRVPYERFQKANTQAKEAKAKAAQLEKDFAALKAQMEERETAGLPELERERKRAEQLEKRAAEAEAKAAEADGKFARSQKERWVTAAAKDFADPADAVAFLNLDEIEDERDAERAVKRLAGQKRHLLKADEPVLPGRVLQGGKAKAGEDEDPKAGLGAELLNQFFSGR